MPVFLYALRGDTRGRGGGANMPKTAGKGKIRAGQKAGGSTGKRIRWRVPELTPNTPGPAASADHCYYYLDHRVHNPGVLQTPTLTLTFPLAGTVTVIITSSQVAGTSSASGTNGIGQTVQAAQVAQAGKWQTYVCVAVCATCARQVKFVPLVPTINYNH